MAPFTKKSTILAVPTTPQALHLRHVLLSDFILPMGSRGLIASNLVMDHRDPCLLPANYTSPLAFIRTPLETVVIIFFTPCSQPCCGEATDTPAKWLFIRSPPLTSRASALSSSSNSLVGILRGTKCYNLPSQFSTLERLLLEHEVHHDHLSSEECHEVNPAKWRKLFRSFHDVKSLRVGVGLSRNFLVVYTRTMESSKRNSYLNCRSLRLHVLEAAILVTRSPHVVETHQNAG